MMGAQAPVDDLKVCTMMTLGVPLPPPDDLLRSPTNNKKEHPMPSAAVSNTRLRKGDVSSGMPGGSARKVR